MNGLRPIMKVTNTTDVSSRFKFRDGPGLERRTLESPFEWVPKQLSRFLTDPTLVKLLDPGAIINYVFR